jgi:protein TIF31
LRDASLGYLTALQAKRLYQPPPYDSSSLAIDAGLTLFPFVSGSNDSPTAEQEKPIVNGHGDVVNGHDGNKSGKRPKGKGKGAPPAPKPSKAAPASSKQPDSTSAEWLTAPSDPLQVHLDRNSYLPSTSLPTSAFKHLALSVWNPPPAHLRLRGHFLYITVNTLEGENFQITASEKGFYINRSDNHHFDPSPRSNTSPSKSQAVQQTFHSIFDLLSAVSPQFLQRTEALVADIPTDFLEFFASAPLATCSPAAPWLVPPPTNVADGTRSQLAYLYTGSTSADTLPSARDWNEELTSMRELPQATNDDRLFRDRYAAKLFSDFQLAAMRAVPSIARGDVPPLNAIDPAEAKSYLVSNILFTQAQDSVDAFAHLGRDEAARVTAGKDLWAAKLLNDADIPKLNPIATAVVDYCGARWVAQAIPPGIFDRGLPGTDKEGSPADTNGEEGANKKASEAKKDTKKESTPAPAGLRAVYGPANTDKPQDGYVAEAVFEPLAKQIAQHFHLAKHTVTDTKGRETELWTPADVHGIIAADGRAYIIDLCTCLCRSLTT